MLAGKRASLSAHGSDPYREVCAAHPPCPSRLLAPGSSRTDWDRDTGGRTGRRAPQLRRHHSLSLEPLHCRPCHQKRAWPALTDMRQQRGCACPLPLALSVKAGQPQARGDRYALAYASTPGSGPSTTLVSRPTLTATLGIFERAAVFEHCCPLFPLMRLLSASRPRRLLATSWFPRTDFSRQPCGRPPGQPPWPGGRVGSGGRMRGAPTGCGGCGRNCVAGAGRSSPTPGTWQSPKGRLR